MMKSDVIDLRFKDVIGPSCHPEAAIPFSEVNIAPFLPAEMKDRPSDVVIQFLSLLDPHSFSRSDIAR